MKIAVLGSGTWGTALARLLSLNGHRVALWSALPAEIDNLAATRRHPNLPYMELPEDIFLTADMASALEGAGLAVFAVPSVFMRSVAAKASPLWTPGTVAVSVAKGVEPGTYMTMTDIIENEIPSLKNTVVALSGPTHAEEVARSMPTAIVSASRSAQAAEMVQRIFSNSFFRVYTNSDILGVELCGAMKNIIALAAGISDGSGYGDNAKAALMTRGMAEIVRVGRAMGCDERTFYGLSGIGDLIVTATSRHSRNNRAGFLIGSGKTAQEAVKEVGMVVEGINALPAALGLRDRFGLEMPITSAVDEIINGGADPKEVVTRLMLREYKGE
ncbi:MAG: NAD(P)-dependent glycerol-3-phosphate dehydrogenase [Oscillospiraceae bacterium]|nr:NAD(P)-dependent glycerol-3-phosphate dehydrogenase [Oscillospiraceae bacterium]